jgi:hypothetical protein
MEHRREKRITTIRRGRYLVEVGVEVTYSPEDPDEPMLDPQTARLLDEIAEHAATGDVAWLRQHGKVYELVDA